MRKEAKAAAATSEKGQRLAGLTACVDPGLTGTGVALFPLLGEEKYAYVRRPIRARRIISPPPGPWQERANWYTDQLFQYLCPLAALKSVYIEWAEVYSSGKSLASAQQGDLLKLALLVGCYQTMLYMKFNIVPTLLSPREWKGQMDKEVIHSRIDRALGKRYKEHTADAVGMGLFLQGWDHEDFWKKVKKGKVH